MSQIVKVEKVAPDSFKDAFDMALNVEEELLNLDTLLSSYEAFVEIPSWVYVIRRHYRPCQERLQVLQIFLAQRLT